MPETDEPLLFGSSSHYVEGRGGDEERTPTRTDRLGLAFRDEWWRRDGGGEGGGALSRSLSLSLSLSLRSSGKNLDEDSQRYAHELSLSLSHVKDKKKKERKIPLLCHQSAPIDKRVSSPLGGRKQMDIQPVCVAQTLLPHIKHNRCQLSYPQETSAQ